MKLTAEQQQHAAECIAEHCMEDAEFDYILADEVNRGLYDELANSVMRTFAEIPEFDADTVDDFCRAVVSNFDDGECPNWDDVCLYFDARILNGFKETLAEHTADELKSWLALEGDEEA